MSAEFDAYARAYAERRKDPIRDQFASDSQFFVERKLLLIRDFFRRRGQDTRRMNWVDLGCGRGDLLRMGQPSFAQVAGCDPSSLMIEECAHLGARHQETSDRVPFDDGDFDLVTAVCVYHHVELALRPALTQEAMRVLKPGGVFCIVEHNPFNPVTQLIVRRSPVDTQACLLTARNARQLLRSAGAEILETRYFLYFPERLYRSLAVLEDSLAPIALGGQFAVFARKSNR